MSILAFYFGLPDGAVYSNLVASGLCSLGVFWRLWVQARKHHKAQMAQAQQQHAERTEQAAQHHEELKQQLAAHCTDIKTHMSAVADAQVSAGAGSNPAMSVGLPAETATGAAAERVVPPAATARKPRRP